MGGVETRQAASRPSLDDVRPTQDSRMRGDARRGRKSSMLITIVLVKIRVFCLVWSWSGPGPGGEGGACPFRIRTGPCPVKSLRVPDPGHLLYHDHPYANCCYWVGTPRPPIRKRLLLGGYPQTTHTQTPATGWVGRGHPYANACYWVGGAGPPIALDFAGVPPQQRALATLSHLH